MYNVTEIDKTWTSHYFFTFPNMFLYIFYIPVHILHSFIYFFYTFWIKHTLVDLMQGCIEAPGGECHSVHLELPFPSSWQGGDQSICLAFHLDWLPLFRWPDTCAYFLTKSGHHQSIVWWCTDNMVLLGDDIYVTFT